MRGRTSVEFVVLLMSCCSCVSCWGHEGWKDVGGVRSTTNAYGRTTTRLRRRTSRGTPESSGLLVMTGVISGRCGSATNAVPTQHNSAMHCGCRPSCGRWAARQGNAMCGVHLCLSPGCRVQGFNARRLHNPKKDPGQAHAQHQVCGQDTAASRWSALSQEVEHRASGFELKRCCDAQRHWPRAYRARG